MKINFCFCFWLIGEKDCRERAPNIHRLISYSKDAPIDFLVPGSLLQGTVDQWYKTHGC